MVGKSGDFSGEAVAVLVRQLPLIYFSCSSQFLVFAGAPGRTVLRTDGVLLGKHDIINK